jgi:hypothetical protein
MMQRQSCLLPALPLRSLACPQQCIAVQRHCLGTRLTDPGTMLGFAPVPQGVFF